MIFHIINSSICVLLLLLNIVLLVIIHRLRNKIKHSKNTHSNITDYVASLISTINSVRYGNLIARLEKHPDKDLNEVSKCINRMIEALNDREKMIVEYQNELKRKNDLLEVVINSLSDGILIFDDTNRIIQYTNNIKKWFGDKKLLNKDISKFIKASDDINIENLNNNEIFIEYETEKSFTASVVKIKFGGNINRYMMIIKDVTNQKEVETLKEDFVATLTHDLKVPIIAESNMLNFLISEKFGELNDKQREAIKNMQASNNELLELVHTVLDTYRISSHGIELYKAPVVLSEFLQETVNEMIPIAEVTKNRIITKFHDDAELLLDKMQMKRVFKNLIQNAISYGQTNSNIEIKLVKKDKNIIITVKDYGKGISKEDIDKIFNKYYSASKKFRKIGTGLGLYLSKEIVEAHDGQLYVTSEENKYTEFSIKLPF